MKSCANIFEVMRERLNSEEFQLLHSLSASNFTRNRVLSFTITFALIFNLIKDSSSAEINKFIAYFNLLGFKISNFTKSAFSQARQKLSWRAFTDLNNTLINEFYKNNKIKTFNGLRVLAIDGLDLQLPISEEMFEFFGYASNQTEKKMPMAKGSQLYDVLNGITIDALICPYTTSEKDMAFTHIDNLKKNNIVKQRKFVIIFDRGYPSVLLIAYLTLMEIPFLIRSSNSFIKQVSDVANNGKKDEIIEVCLKRLNKSERSKLLSYFPEIDFTLSVKIRVCIVKLSTGENEILLTSILDKKKFPRKIFCKFYFNRWGIETDIGFQKCRAEIENFCGETIIGVKQEYHATILYKNVTQLLALEAKWELDKTKELMEQQKQNKKNDLDENQELGESNKLKITLRVNTEQKIDLQHLPIINDKKGLNAKKKVHILSN